MTATEPAGLQPPTLRGWPALQAHLVHRIKRGALRQLHASVAGERFLLHLYLAGEEASERALRGELRAGAPHGVARQLEQHLADEQLHARLFAEAIHERGGVAPAAAPEARADPDQPTRKAARWHALIRRHASQFEAGAFVPAYAIGLAAEQTAVRILRRHCDLIGSGHALHPLLLRVLHDEERHARLCGHTLLGCVAPHEQPSLQRLLCEVRASERRFGVTGAVGMWFAGIALRWFGSRITRAAAA